MRSCEVQTIATDDGISTGRRGFRSHHIVTRVNEEGYINTITVHPHGLDGFNAALAQIQENPDLNLKFLRAFVDPTTSSGMHGQTKNRGGDGATHTPNELRSENADFSRVQERELTAQLTTHPNLNITRTPYGYLIITEKLADQHFRKITITSAPDMLPDHGTRTDLAIVVYEEINGKADPEQSSLLGVNLFLQPIDISIEQQTPNFSAKELLQTVATGMRIFQMFAGFDETYRNKFSGRLTDNLNPNANHYKGLDPRHAKLFRSLSGNRFEIQMNLRG